MKITPKITPFLWYQKDAEKAAAFYCSLFPDSEILEQAPTPDGKYLSVTFRLGGQTLIAFNGGEHYQLSPALSLMVSCQSQDEIDRLWSALLENGGQPLACGWITDQFGLSWQITPERLLQLMRDPDNAKAMRVMQSMMTMIKLDIAALEAAANS
jgi:predicted 3-demethylubiquinone-9 3-methyltransferase (glyoxalase superfamily)